MEPFTMMLGYGLINSLSQLVVRPLTDKMTSSSRQAEMMFQMETKHALDLESVRLNKQIEFENQIRVQEFCHRHRLQEAQSQFEKQLHMWQLGHFNDKMWPLRTPYDHPSLRLGYHPDQHIPINVFLAETDPRSPFSMNIKPDLKTRLSNFLQTVYVNDPKQHHPVICRIGDWKEGFQDAAFINALWYGMQGQPTIVVNPIMAEYGETLDLNVSIWGLGELGFSPRTENVISGSFASAIGRIKREKTQEWISHGLPVDSKEMIYNRELLKREADMVAEGNGAYIDKLLIQYQLPKEIQAEVYTKFSREYNHLVSCVTGMYADIYHLIEYGSEPYMPIAINQYNQINGNTFQIPQIVAQHYRKTLTNMVCTNYLQDKLPGAFMGVAKSLSFNPTDAMGVFQEGVGLWANKKLDLNCEIDIPTSIDECLKLLYDNSNDSDYKYLEKAKETLISMNQLDAANVLNRKISVLVKTDIRNDTEENEEVDWPVLEKVTFTDVDFYLWIKEYETIAMKNGATYAVAYFRDYYFALFFTNKDAKAICNRSITGQSIIAQKYYFPYDIMPNKIAVYDLLRKSYNVKSEQFMEKKEFDSFEKLGRQLDALMNNLGRLSSRPARVIENKGNVELNDFEKRLTDIFLNSRWLSLESDTCDVAEFVSIKNWIESKRVAVIDAASAHIFKTATNDKTMICVFFSDFDENALLGDSYPMKRILCSKCDSDIEVFLNGLSFGTIKL